MRREVLTEFLLVSLVERDHVKGLPLRWGDNIKMDVKEQGCVPEWCGSRLGQVAGCCENGNEHAYGIQ
jgi:hypothetical protein